MSVGYSNREKRILHILCDACDYVSCTRIADEIGKSTKTIRTDIAQIRKASDSSVFVIDSMPHHGYRINILDPMAFEAQTDILEENASELSMRSERGRIYALAFYLVCQDGPSTLDKIEDEFYLSRSVLLRELERTRIVLSHSGILCVCSGEKVTLIGNEYKKRIYLASAMRSKRYHEPSMNQLLFPRNLQEIVPVLVQEIAHLLEGYPITLSGNDISILAFYLAISCRRNYLGSRIDNIPDELAGEINAYANEVSFASQVMRRAREFGLENLNNSDNLMTSLLIIASAYPLYQLSADREEGTRRLLNHIAQIMESPLAERDISLRKGVGSFLNSWAIRRKYNISDPGIAVRRIKQRMPSAIELSYQVLKAMETDYHIVITEREVAKLAVVLEPIVYRSLMDTAKTIGVYSRFGREEANRLLMHLQRSLPEESLTYRVVDSADIYHDSPKWDYLVTDDEDVCTDLPHYVLKVFESPEWDYGFKSNIRGFLSQRYDFRNLRCCCIKSNVDAKSAKEVYQYVSLLFNEVADTHEDISEQLEEKNEELPFQVGDRTALIVHRSEAIREPAAFFTVLNHPFMWEINQVSLVIALFCNGSFESLSYLYSIAEFMNSRADINYLIRKKVFRPSVMQ